MEDPNHKFTDEEIQNTKVGMSPGPDAPTEEGLRENEEKIADRKANSEDDIIPGGQKSTPWDVISPGA